MRATGPFNLIDRLDPEKDVDGDELGRTVNAIDDLNDRPHGERRAGTFDRNEAFAKIEDYQRTRNLKVDGKMNPKGPTAKRIAAEKHLHGRTEPRRVAIPIKAGVGPGQPNRAADVRAVANGLTLAGHRAVLPKADNPDTPDHASEAAIRKQTIAAQRAHGEKPDGVVKRGGPTQSLLGYLAAPHVAHLAGADPDSPKPFQRPEPATVGRTKRDRPSTIITFQQDERTLPDQVEHEAAVEVLSGQGGIDRLEGGDGEDRLEMPSESAASPSVGERNDHQAEAREHVRQTFEPLGAGQPLNTMDLVEEMARNRPEEEPQLKPYRPSPSEERSFKYRQQFGPVTGTGIDRVMDWIDPATPIFDFVHRRRMDEPYNLEDYLVLLSLGGATGAVGRKGAIKLSDLIDEKSYYRGADGSKDLGRVDDDIYEQSGGKFRGAPLRMRRGKPGTGGYGARHITPDKHERAQELGYRNGLELIEDVAKRHDLIIEQAGNGRLMFVARDDRHRYAVAEFHPATGWRRLLGKKDEYSITTGFADTSRNARNDKRTSKAGELRKGGTIQWEQR